MRKRQRDRETERQRDRETERKSVSPSLRLSVSLSLRLFAAHVNLAVNDIDDEAGEGLPQVRDRQFDLFVDRAFEEARAVSRAESLLDQAIDGGLGNGHALALARHLALNCGQVELGDLFNFVLSQRPEDNDLVDAVAEIRRASGTSRLQIRVLDLADVGRGLLTESKRFNVLLEILGAEVRGHDDDRVGEVNFLAAPVGQPAFVESLRKRLSR